MLCCLVSSEWCCCVARMWCMCGVCRGALAHQRMRIPDAVLPTCPAPCRMVLQPALGTVQKIKLYYDSMMR